MNDRLQLLYTARKCFGPENDNWARYIDWSGLGQLREVVSLDTMLCPPALGEMKDHFWEHVVQEDFMLDFFYSLDFVRSECKEPADANILCVVRRPLSEVADTQVASFIFLGYDLVDMDVSVSALTNCGGFPAAFANWELTTSGLIADFDRAVEIRSELRRAYPNESHAECDVWAIWRLAA